MKNHTEMSDQDRVLIDEIEAARRVLRMQDKAFHAAFLPGDYWTWLNARSVGVTAKVLAGYRAVLPLLREEVAAAARVRQRIASPSLIPDFVSTKSTRLVENVVRAAVRGDETIIGRAGGKQRRIVLVLGVTDSGKSALRDRLAAQYNAPIVRLTESCRTNATAIHADLQSAFGAERAWATRAAREQATFRLLSTEAGEPPRVVIYDESLRLGPSTCNVLCDINDATNAVQIVFGLPELIDRLAGRGWAESSQFMSRVLETVELGELRPEDIRPLLEPCGLNGSGDAVAKELAAVANEYGRFGMVRRVVASIQRSRAHSIDEICGDLSKPREQRVGIIPDEREALRVQRMTERLRAAQEKRSRVRNLRFADRTQVSGKAGSL